MRRFVTGLAEHCYNGVSVIRGYASADILIKSSVAHSAYQREKSEKHVDDILSFIQKGDYTFLPEIILSYDYKNLYDQKYLDLLERLDSEKVLFDKDFDLRIRNLSSRPCKHLRLSFPESIERQPFHRLDGNHRLEALAKLSESKQRTTIVPFAILLFCSEFEKSEMLRNEMMVFHNLNSKGLKLSSEQQLRGLLTLFSEEELDSFGDEISGIKRYATRYKTVVFRNLKQFLVETFPSLKVFWNSPYSILQRTLQISKREKSLDPASLNKALRYVDDKVFAQYPILQETKCVDLLPIYVHYVTSSGGAAQRDAKVMLFTNWLLSNKLYMNKKMDAICTIAIFDKLYDIRRKQIFVAMPFDDKLYFVMESIKRCVQTINNEFHLEIPVPIRIDEEITGFSYDIVQRILDNIRGAGLLIADLTYHNANVYYEAGYAQGLIHAKLGNTTQILYLISNPNKPDEPFEEGKFDVQHYKMIPYKNDGNGSSELEKQLMQELKKFYNIQESNC